MSTTELWNPTKKRTSWAFARVTAGDVHTCRAVVTQRFTPFRTLVDVLVAVHALQESEYGDR